MNDIPATISVAEAAKLLGVSRSFAYSLIRDGRFPVAVIKLGGRIIVPSAPLLELLGIEALGSRLSRSTTDV